MGKSEQTKKKAEKSKKNQENHIYNNNNINKKNKMKLYTVQWYQPILALEKDVRKCISLSELGDNGSGLSHIISDKVVVLVSLAKAGFFGHYSARKKRYQIKKLNCSFWR